MELILVPKGTITTYLGDIIVDKDFYIGKYEVKQKQWYDTMQDNNNNIHAYPPTGYEYGEGDNFPVYYVSWYDSLVFCNRLSRLENLTPVYSIKGTTDDNLWGDSPTSYNIDWSSVSVDTSASGYRLPTRAEWIYSVRGGSNGNIYTYPGSNNINEVAWYLGNSAGIMYEVGTKLPNELGIYDMSGNVREYILNKDSIYDNVIGGNFSSTAYECAILTYEKSTSGVPEELRYQGYGFRVARNASISASGITIKTPPIKTTYAVGETFSTDGLEIEATMSDGSKKIATNWSATVPDMSTPGIKVVTVTYTEGGVTVETTFNIIVAMKEIKLDMGLYSSALSPAYYSGYFNKMYSDGLNMPASNEVYFNPNVLPKIYEYGIEINGEIKQYGLQIPLLPQEEKEIYIENYIMPESSTFNSLGFVADMDKYYGKYGTEDNSTLPYNREFYKDGEHVEKYFPFNLLTDKVYNNSDGNIEYRDFNNGNIEFHFLPGDKDGYKSKIVIKNKNPLSTSTYEISPLFVTASMVQISAVDYSKIKIGNVLKLSKVYSDKSSSFNSIYELYKEYKYKIIGMREEDSKYYIVLDKIYPYLLDNAGYMKAELFTENIIHLNYLSIRGNPLVVKNGEYSFEDKYSIDRYGEKTVSIKSGLFDLEYFNKFANMIVSERKSVEYDSMLNMFFYDSKRTKFIAEFSLDNYTIALGDLIYITEDYFYNIVKEPFKVIGISRINSTNGERKTKIKALSVNLKKDKLVSEFEEVETSSIKSISSLDPTNYLTDKTILNATYTNDFGEVYTSTQNVSKVLSINGNEVEISTVAVDLDTEEIILSIRDQFFDMVSLENDISSVHAILLGDLSSIEVGDSVYIYKKSITSKPSEISYTSAKGKDKLYLEWNCSTAYDYSSITVFEVGSYEEAIATGKTTTANISNFKGSKIIVGASRDIDLAIQQDKYYVIKIVLFDLDGKEIDDGKITIYSPNSTKTIKGVV